MAPTPFSKRKSVLEPAAIAAAPTSRIKNRDCAATIPPGVTCHWLTITNHTEFRLGIFHEPHAVSICSVVSFARLAALHSLSRRQTRTLNSGHHLPIGQLQQRNQGPRCTRQLALEYSTQSKKGNLVIPQVSLGQFAQQT